MTDPTDEPTAYTYEDAARLCGVSTETIRLRARRGKLQKGRPTNTNRPTVLMTAADIEAISAGRPLTGRPDGQIERPDGQASGQTGRPDGQSSEIRALTDHVATLREDLERERGRVDAAERRAERAEQSAKAADSRAEGLREKVAITGEELTAARAELEQVRAAAKVAVEQAGLLEKAEAERQGRGRLARLWTALRG